MSQEQKTLAMWAVFSCPLSGFVNVSTQGTNGQQEILRIGPFRSISFDRSGSAYGILFGRVQNDPVPIADLFAHGTWTVDTRHLPSGSGSMYRLMRIDATLVEG